MSSIGTKENYSLNIESQLVVAECQNFEDVDFCSATAIFGEGNF